MSIPTYEERRQMYKVQDITDFYSKIIFDIARLTADRQKEVVALIDKLREEQRQEYDKYFEKYMSELDGDL